MSILTFIFWWGALPLQIGLLWLMLRGKFLRTFPWFFTYTLYSVLATTSRLVFRNHELIYSYIYWISDAVYAVLGIAVMYEVFYGVFRKLLRLWWFRPVFPVVILVTFALTVGRTRELFVNEHWITPLILAGEMGVRLVQVAMFTLLVALVALFGLRWRQHYFGICAGFGVYSTAALFASTRYSEIGSRFAFWWDVISVMSYNAAVLIWLMYFRVPIAIETPRSEEPPLSLQALERYKEIARRAQRP